MVGQSHQHVRLFAPGATVIAAGLIWSIMGTAIADGASARAQDTKAEQVFVTVCGRCHPIERITAMRRSRRQWEETIEAMITTRGAQVSDDDFDTILKYLTKVYGRVDINRAPADEIVEVLAVKEDSAAAIVAYRKEHGPFEDFEALLKVPGIDRQALEAQRDAISF